VLAELGERGRLRVGRGGEECEQSGRVVGDGREERRRQRRGRRKREISGSDPGVALTPLRFRGENTPIQPIWQIGPVRPPRECLPYNCSGDLVVRAQRVPKRCFIPARAPSARCRRPIRPSHDSDHLQVRIARILLPLCRKRLNLYRAHARRAARGANREVSWIAQAPMSNARINYVNLDVWGAASEPSAEAHRLLSSKALYSMTPTGGVRTAI
jgi:hypothetical protein